VQEENGHSVIELKLPGEGKEGRSPANVRTSADGGGSEALSVARNDALQHASNNSKVAKKSVKAEPAVNGSEARPLVERENNSDDDDDVPLSSLKGTSRNQEHTKPKDRGSTFSGGLEENGARRGEAAEEDEDDASILKLKSPQAKSASRTSLRSSPRLRSANPARPEVKRSYAEDSGSEEEDIPLSRLKKRSIRKQSDGGSVNIESKASSAAAVSNGVEEDGDEDDVPLSRLKATATKKMSARTKTPASKSAAKNAEQDGDDDDISLSKLKDAKKADIDDDAPLTALKKSTAVTKTKPEKKVKTKRAGSTSPLAAPKKKLLASINKSSPADKSTPSVKKTIVKKIKKKKTVVKKGAKSSRLSQGKSGAAPSMKKDEYVFVGGDEADEKRWWEEGPEANEIKWQTLSHHGVVFPPEYEPVGAPLVYDGEKIVLPPAAEEVGMFYAAKLATDYVKKPVFNKNFFSDFRAVLKKENRDLFKKIKEFSKCDFSRMQAHLEEKKAQQKAVPAAERKAAREAEAERVKKYTTALVDGREEKVGNFRIEPPALFLGRGEHPLMGKVKKRIYPEDVTINVGKNDPVPECPIAGHKWGRVIHNNTVTWLAFWRDTITNGFKYVWLAADSKFKTISDAAKFEKARKLHGHIEKIRADYRKGWTARDKFVQQRSVALYLIDHLALRVGNEKGGEEADTVGCCSLRVEHLSFQEPDTIEFDFLGKDSIRYYNSVSVDKTVFTALKKLTEKKKKDAEVFDKLTTTTLNEYLKSLMDGLSAKVFRTYNASLTLDRLLRQQQKNMSLNDKLVFYNQQNKEVAILCNHQRSLPKAHEAQMGKMSTKLEETEEWLRTLEGAIEKLERRGGDSISVTQWVHPKPQLTPEMSEEQKSAERKRAAEAPRESVVRTMKLESLRNNAERTRQRIDKMKADIQTKEDLKTVALGTSKINYLDPRISVSWCKLNEVPIERIFPKALTMKFAWSMEASENFVF